MSLILDGTNGLTFNNATTQNSGGKVLQVVNATSAGQVGTTSTSYVTTGVSASITPLFSTSKILILFNTNITNTTPTGQADLTVYRGATSLAGVLAHYENAGGSGYSWVPASVMWLDSPTTTSATTYTIYYKQAVGGTAYMSSGTLTNVFTLMEVVA